jgi:hypothetical protein
VTAAQTLRHEDRLKEHQQWLEENELAYAKHRAMLVEHVAMMAGLDEKLTQIAAAQLVTEEKLNGLIDALRRGGNGHK